MHGRAPGLCWLLAHGGFVFSSELGNLKEPSYSVDDVIALEIEVKGSVEPFQVLLEPYALVIPGENYIGINVKRTFKMWNYSKSAIRYTWGKISDCHIVEVEPCTGTIECNEVEDFELKFTGGVPGPTSQNLLCEIRDSPSPVVLHIEAAFKGPALAINISALQFGLLRLGQKASNSIEIQNTSPLPAMWSMKESPICLKERPEGVSPFTIEPSSGQVQPLGDCQVNITLEALQCQRLQTLLELELPPSVCRGTGAPCVPTEQPGGAQQPLPGRAHEGNPHAHQWHTPAHPVPLGQAPGAPSKLLHSRSLPQMWHTGPP